MRTITNDNIVVFDNIKYLQVPTYNSDTEKLIMFYEHISDICS